MVYLTSNLSQRLLNRERILRFNNRLKLQYESVLYHKSLAVRSYMR